MRAAVVVLSWNAADEALACLASLAAQERPADRTIVVDNASADGSADRIAAAFPAAELFRNPRNLGFSGGMNVALRALLGEPAPPDVAVLLNQDTAADPGWLAGLLAPLADGSVGAVGSKIRFPGGALQHAGAALEWPRAIVRHVGWGEADEGQYDAPRDYELLTGAALALRLGALAEVGVFDEGYAPAYYEDADLCWRLWRAGHRLVYAPAATLAHQESHSTRDTVTRMAYYHRGRLRYVVKRLPIDELTAVFAPAEEAYLAAHAAAPEGRALRWAYAEALSALPETLAARASFHPPEPRAADAIREMLLGLQRTQSRALYASALATAATLR
jgi:GT2 family glycosyltransferase